MFSGLSELTKGAIFYAIVFALVVGVAFAPLPGQMLLLVAMAMPTVAVLLMLLVVTRDGFSKTGWASLGLHRAGLKGWPLAVLAPLAVLGIANALIWNTGVATFTPPADLDAAGWAVGLAQGIFSNLADDWEGLQRALASSFSSVEIVVGAVALFSARA